MTRDGFTRSAGSREDDALAWSAPLASVPLASVPLGPAHVLRRPFGGPACFHDLPFAGARHLAGRLRGQQLRRHHRTQRAQVPIGPAHADRAGAIHSV